MRVADRLLAETVVGRRRFLAVASATGLADATTHGAVGTGRRRGALVSLRARAEARDGGRDVSMTTTNRFTGIGETTVERPAWAGG